MNLTFESKLLAPAGQAYEYSNVGYSLLGAIVEIVTGASYERYLHDHLFEPAAMRKTGYVIPQWGADELARGYRGDEPWGTPRDHPWAEDGPFWHLRANGGILSTASDMYRWHVALLGEKVLSRKAKVKLFEP